ncbi:MAG: hypothetical protein IAE94_12975 [Chthoniobacterales bacterium]|nr:hypothetical protein [Chthoniobacterales bacterium]
MAWHGKFLTALIAGGLLAVFATSLEARETPSNSRTVSASGQFVIYSKDPTRRTNLSRRADEARGQWLQKIGSETSDNQTIIIQDLIGTPKPRNIAGARTGIFEADGGSMKIQVDLYDAAVLRNQALEMEIFRALALARIYKERPPKAGKAFHYPPSWLLEGLCEERRMAENGSPSGLQATLLKSENPPRIEEFLKSKPELMEATSLTLYRIEALALLQTLQQLSEGQKGLGAFLDSLAENEPDLKRLLAAYPSLENNPSRLGKLWTLAIARSSASKGTEPDSIGETVRALKELLDVSAPLDPKKPELGKVTGAAAFPAIARSEGGGYLMRQKAAELMTLEFRSHPLLRPVIGEYRQITTQLASKPKKNLGKQIGETDKILDLLLQRSDKVGDYLNWFEATQLDTLSENFLEGPGPSQPPQRTDPLSLHLDAIENHGW